MILTTTIEVLKVELPKMVVRAMVVVDMNSMPPKVIGKKNCLWAKGPLGLSKDPKPKKHLNI
jgi:hypothetical protein